MYNSFCLYRLGTDSIYKAPANLPVVALVLTDSTCVCSVFEQPIITQFQFLFAKTI